MLLLVENCLVRTYHVEEKPVKCFSRRKGSHNIFGPNTSEYSLTRKNLHGKRGGCLSFFLRPRNRQKSTKKGLLQNAVFRFVVNMSFGFVIMHIFYASIRNEYL